MAFDVTSPTFSKGSLPLEPCIIYYALSSRREAAVSFLKPSAQGGQSGLMQRESGCVQGTPQNGSYSSCTVFAFFYYCYSYTYNYNVTDMIFQSCTFQESYYYITGVSDIDEVSQVCVFAALREREELTSKTNCRYVTGKNSTSLNRLSF